MRDDRLFLIHILECISRIEQYSAGGSTVFFEDTRTQDAVLRNLQTMAEPTTRLSQVSKSGHPAVDWSGIAGFRNVLVHNYLGVDLEQVWDIVTQDVPGLKVVIESMIRELGT